MHAAPVFAPARRQEKVLGRRRHDRLYLHGSHPRKTMVLNHGLPPLRTMVLKIPALAPGYRKEHSSGCRGGQPQPWFWGGRGYGSRPWFCEGGGPCRYRQAIMPPLTWQIIYVLVSCQGLHSAPLFAAAKLKKTNHIVTKTWTKTWKRPKGTRQKGTGILVKF